jgi:predicted enzyme related to lactoylglutathione lyase
MASPHGTFVWYELMTTDAAAAETFYKSMIGWNAQDAGYPDFRYTLLSVGDTQVAGLMTLPKEACDAGAKPGWMGYVAVEDVDDYTARFMKAGGIARRPTSPASGVSQSSPIRRAPSSRCSKAPGHRRRPRRTRRVMRDGASCWPPMLRPHSHSIRRCSGGPRAMRPTSDRWAPISFSHWRAAANPSAA